MSSFSGPIVVHSDTVLSFRRASPTLDDLGLNLRWSLTREYVTQILLERGMSALVALCLRGTQGFSTVCTVDPGRGGRGTA